MKVAAVSSDASIRMELARAFDSAPLSWEVQLHDRAPAVADVVVVGSDIEGVDGIPFDPKRPDAMLAGVASAMASAGTSVVTVTGTGGGVGVTSIALHLAWAASRSASTSGPACYLESRRARGARTRLGLEPTARTWGDVSGPDTIGIAALPVRGGFRALLAPEEPSDVERDIASLALRNFPSLVVDVAPEDRPSLPATTVLVLTPTRTSAERAAAILERDESPARCALVLNRLGRGGETTRSQIERIVGRRVALELPCSPALRDAEDDAGLLTTPVYRWPRRIAALWRALERS